MFLTADQITRLMTNHPNRNWRRAMHSAADSHLAGYRWPEGSGAHVMTPDQLREALRAAYMAGYADGRLSTMPTRNPIHDTR